MTIDPDLEWEVVQSSLPRMAHVIVRGSIHGGLLNVNWFCRTIQNVVYFLCRNLYTSKCTVWKHECDVIQSSSRASAHNEVQCSIPGWLESKSWFCRNIHIHTVVNFLCRNLYTSKYIPCHVGGHNVSVTYGGMGEHRTWSRFDLGSVWMRRCKKCFSYYDLA